MRVNIKSIFIFLLFSSMLACSKDDDQGLTLADIQAEAIAEENRFKLTTFVNIFEFNTNNIDLEVDGSYYLFSAFSGNEALYVRFPEITKGTFLGVNDPEIFLLYVGQDGRNYLSTNDAFNSDVRFTITAVDSLNSVFYADFSGTLYDIEARNPNNRENQVSIFGGRINKVSF